MTEISDKLIRTRASYKGQFTSFCTYLNGLGKVLTEADLDALKLRIAKIKSVYNNYDEVQLQIECLVTDIDKQIAERAEFESLYFKTLAQAEKLVSLSIASDNEPPSSRSGIKLVRLPPIPVPTFSGAYETWLEFHDTFISLVHSNDGIDDITKFHHLRSALKDSAALVIQSIELSSANYPIAWDLLCERYDNKKLLVQNHVSALFNLESVEKETSFNLKRIIDQVFKHLRSLESLGEPTTHWDTLLIYMITTKLDPRSYRQWEECKSKYQKNESIKLSHFMVFLRGRADLLETLELSNNNNSHTSQLKPVVKHKSMVFAVNQNQNIDSQQTKGT